MEWYVKRTVGGTVTGLLRWPEVDNQERLSEDHPDIIEYRTVGARFDALNAVKAAARNKLNDIDSSVTKNALKTAIQPFKTQFQDASTVADVGAVRVAALAAIEAL